jgi:4-hydroxy-tetrahydrodipicolinate synthase
MNQHTSLLFEGCATALVTPFRNGELDKTAYLRILRRQIQEGADALVVAGTTGESATLTPEEHRELVSFSKERIAGRVPLLAGCGSNSTKHAIELAESVSDAGADALLVVTPYYCKASDRGLILHYRAIADRATRPLILYNVPSRTGVSLTLRHYRELSSHENIIGVKEASGDLSLLEALCAECGNELDVWTGNDTQTVASMRLGAIGVISVASNVLPHAMVELCRLLANKDHRTAEQRMLSLRERIDALFGEVNPIPVKYVAAMKGLCAAEYRLPLCPPSPELARRLQSLFYS